MRNFGRLPSGFTLDLAAVDLPWDQMIIKYGADRAHKIETDLRKSHMPKRYLNRYF